MRGTASVLLLLLLLAAAVPTHAQSLTIHVVYPLSAHESLSVRGDGVGLRWDADTPLHRDPDGRTSSLTLNIPQGKTGEILSFKATLGVSDSSPSMLWEIGANHQVTLPGNDTTISIFPWFRHQKGTLEVLHNVYSPQLQNSRSIITYLPPSYLENTWKVYKDVLVMHDGQNLFDPATAFLGQAWMCQDTVNPLITQGSMREILIVGVYNTEDRIDEYTYSYDPTEKAGGKGNEYLDFLEEQILPLIRSKYRIAPQAEFGILGSSLGGLISCYAGWTRTSFVKAGCMSSSFWWNNQDFNSTVMETGPKLPGIKTYLDSGNQGPGQDDLLETITVRDHMEEYGLRLGQDLFYYLDKGGQHSEQYWRERFWVPMTDLYPPYEDAEMNHHLLEEHHPGRHGE